MSQKFENIFKEALRNQEVPYNPKAWDSLSKSLDKAMPVTGKKPFSPWAAVIIAVALVGGASVWYFAGNNNDKPTNNNSRTSQTVNKDETNLNKNTVSNSNITETNTKLSDANSSDVKSVELNSKDNSKPVSTSQVTGPPPIVEDIRIEENRMWDIVPPPVPVSAGNNASGKPNLDLVKIGNTCQFMDKKISNESDVQMIIEFPSGFEVVINPKTSKIVDFSEFGTYSVSNSSRKRSTFVVYENKAVDFTIDQEHIYNNGIPSTEVKIMNASPNSNIQWISKQANQTRSGNKAEFNFFKDGDYTISVTSTNNKGCSTVATKKVAINNEYNLLAVTAIKPQDIDPRVNSFMPTALIERNTAFSMIIIDPKDGGVIYETTDATAGWNGTDKRTGKPAIHGSNYIWKVSMSNPLPGEAASYKGIVTVIID